MTPERFRRCKSVLERRQPDLTVLMDNVHKPHNLSAIVRSCDAVGAFEVHAITDRISVRVKKDVASGTGKWVNITPHPDLMSARNHLKQQNMQILAAHPAQDAVDFREIDYTKPTAILLGAELTGVSNEGLELADQLIFIPMLGMVDSLNVSVAAALILFEAQRQRMNAGLYERTNLDKTAFERILFEWSQPRIAEFYRRKKLPYPAQDEDGNVLETETHINARLKSAGN